MADTQLTTEEQKKKIQQKEREEKLQTALKNNLQISNLGLPNKFRSFENWELTRSRRLLFEINRTKTNYWRYPRGTIVKVDFGVNIGGEFSEQHFAITLNKKDNMNNNILTVIPLTSKNHGANSVGLKSLIVDMYLKKLKEESEKLTNEFSCITNLSEKEADSFKQRIDEIKVIIDYYDKLKDNFSYALVDQIRTISKLNINLPINEYDIVNKTKCTEGDMIKIDKAIAKQFLDIDYSIFEEFYDEQKNNS